MNRRTSILCVATAVCGFFVAHLTSGLSTPIRSVDAQAGGATHVMTSTATQNVAFCFVLNPVTNQLISYTQKTNGGLELKAIRYLGEDFNRKFIEFPKSRSKTSVKAMKEMAPATEK